MRLLALAVPDGSVGDLSKKSSSIVDRYIRVQTLVTAIVAVNTHSVYVSLIYSVAQRYSY